MAANFTHNASTGVLHDQNNSLITSSNEAAMSDKYLAVYYAGGILIYTKDGDYFNKKASIKLTGDDIKQYGGNLGQKGKVFIDITDTYLAILDTTLSNNSKLYILKKNDSDNGWTRIAIADYNIVRKRKKWSSSASAWEDDTSETPTNIMRSMIMYVKIIGNTVIFPSNSSSTSKFYSFNWFNIKDNIDTNNINNANNLSDLYSFAGDLGGGSWELMICDSENLYFGNNAGYGSSERVVVVGKDESDDRVWVVKQTINKPSDTNNFGKHAIASDGNTLVISAPSTGNTGVAVAYSKTNNTWGNPQNITPVHANETYFSSELAVFGNIILGRGNRNYLNIIERTTNQNGTVNSWETASKREIRVSNYGAVNYYNILFNNHQALLESKYLFNNSNPWVDPAETKAINVLGNTFVNKLKLTNFSTSTTGFKEVDSTRSSEIKSYLASATDKEDRRSKRLNLIKYLFLKNKSLKKISLSKEDLNLPSEFRREKAVIIKAGETFDVSDLSNNEGFYAVLEDDESVSFTLDTGTVKFTRNDDIVSSKERYYITDENDDDLSTDNINISQPPETNQGTFSDTVTSGYLVEDDVIIIDGRKFLIGSVADGQNSNGSAGDPYVFPLKSNTPVKLPNKPAFYRMFEQGNNYVNIEVDRASDEHKKRMFEYARKFTPVTHNIVMDGYFYKKLFISAEGNDIVIDYNTKKASCNEEALKFFEMTNFKKRFECGEFFEDCMCYNIKWKTCENKRVDVQILFFPNPHIENGINIMPQTLKNSTGMMIDNFKPKLMEIPSLTTKKFSKLHRKLNKSKNIHQKMNIKGKNEKWCFN